MWVNIIRDQEKPLSPVELITVTAIPDHYVEASDVLDALRQTSTHWQPERGSIYPVLHRMVQRGLLRQAADGRMAFRRTQAGSQFLSSQFPSLTIQIEAMTQYLGNIASGLIEIDPISAAEFLDDFQTITENLQEKIAVLKTEAEEIAKRDNWHRVKVD